jgi:hypothetical protein
MENQFGNQAQQEAAPALAAVLEGTAVHQFHAETPTADAAVQQQPQQPQQADEADVQRFVFGEDSATHKGGTCVVVNLFGSGCLDCIHLVEDADTDFRKCHFSKGNTNCPAAIMRIQFVGARVKWEAKAKKVLAMEKGTDRQNAIMAFMDEAREIEEQGLRQYVLGLVGI